MSIKCYKFVMDENGEVVGSKEIPCELPEEKHGIDRINQMLEHVEPDLKTNKNNRKLHLIYNSIKSCHDKYNMASDQTEKAQIIDKAENAYDRYLQIEEDLFI